MAEMVVDMQRRLNAHEARIAELESAARGPGLPSQTSNSVYRQNHEVVEHDASSLSDMGAEELEDSALNYGAQGQASKSEPSRVRLDILELASPIATLKSLGALDARRSDGFSPYDPIILSVLSAQEAQDAIDIYFDNCHPWAPVLSEDIRITGMSLRRSNPALFLSIVSVGCRFWHRGSPHTRYHDLVKLLDSILSNLILCPTPHDAGLDSIRAIMVYLQWMPCTRNKATYSPQRASRTKPRTRYNDMSAWAMFGLALRYASFMNLEQLALAPFRLPANSLFSKDDVDRMRVWCNLVTYDCNLTLTSGLPASVDPSPLSKVVRKFCLHQSAQGPGDIRYAALVELVCIALRAKKPDSETASSRCPSTSSLKKINMEMGEWERHWLARLGRTRLQHTQLPFTSLRWYRLSLNSSILRPLLSFSTRSGSDPFPAWALEFLETSLTAASQMLISLSVGADRVVWGLTARDPSSYPAGPFKVDPAARFSLHHAIDTTWISHTFALTFLVLCYIRNTIDEDLRIIHSQAAGSSTTCAPFKPRPGSTLARLCRLAVDIFEADSGDIDTRPEGCYTAIVRDAASLVLGHSREEPTQIAQDPLNPAVQSIFDLMEDAVFDWSGWGDDAGFSDTWALP
ncbi:hypothetical protein GQ53DRAFT_49766 [Thozetella sp. PMI_491]|nr:hypothetical protein GQ53DRAFT_49766 [Thozetella sp. PMI_491]